MHVSLSTASALLLYLAAAGMLLFRALDKGPSPVREHRGPALALATLAGLISVWTLYHTVFTPRGPDLGFFDTMALVGWLVALITLLATLRHPIENIGIVVFPAAGLSLAAAQLFPTDRLMIHSRGWALDAHILISLVAYSLLSIAAVQALLLAMQENALRKRRPGGLLGAMPPLQIMESFMFQMIAAGYVLLSMALFTGFLFVDNIFAQHLVHKTVLSVAAWLVFGILLWGRWRFGWRGRTAIRWTLGGFLFLMLAYFGSKLVLELVLGRHWMLGS